MVGRTPSPEGTASARGRAWAYAVSAAAIVAILWPLFGDPQADSFPLSTYPMFSGRKSSEASVPHVVGFTATGKRVALPPDAVANDEVVQAFETIRQAIRQGDVATAALCQDAAAWAASHRSDEIVSVSVVTDTYDSVRYFEGDKIPRASQTHAECVVAS